MNILILNWRGPKNPRAGGAEIVTLQHAKGWVKAGHQVVWLTSAFPGSSREDGVDGVKVVRRGNEKSIYLWAVWLYFRSYHGKVDLVVDQIHGFPFLTPLYVREVKLAFIHEVAGDIWTRMYGRTIGFLGQRIEKWALSRYKKIPFLTVSPSTAKDLIDLGIPQKSVHVIYNGITCTPVYNLPEKEEVWTLLFLNRLAKMKGVEDIIRVGGILKEQNFPFQIWIIGRGEEQYTFYLKELVKSEKLENCIEFLGFVSEEEKLHRMQRAHLLLHPSVKEGWGLVVIEAASQCTPSVVYNVAGLRDSVKSGETGIICQVNRPEVMAYEVMKLLKDRDRYSRFQGNAIDWSKNFTWTEAIEGSLVLVESLFSAGVTQ